jgi:hypothetical protein
VIIKLTDDGKSTFKTMHKTERMRIQNEIISAVGEPRESTVLMGGDLAVVVHNKNQQADLMALKNILGRPVLCSLPNSASAYRTGVIFGVPITKTTEEILEALADQNVTHVKRLTVRGKPEIWSETIILAFSTSLPERVKMASHCFKVQISVPNPYRCLKCWRLGHTLARCRASQKSCKNCGRPHPSKQDCIRRCINCEDHNHDADCNDCPAYLEAKGILKMAYVEGITVSEARTRMALLKKWAAK